MAIVEVQHVKWLFAEYVATNIEFAETLTKEAWGGTTFTIRDPDGNRLCFSQPTSSVR